MKCRKRFDQDCMCTFLGFWDDLTLSFLGYHTEIALYIGSYIIIITWNDVISFVVRSDFFGERPDYAYMEGSDGINSHVFSWLNLVKGGERSFDIEEHVYIVIFIFAMSHL